MSFVKDTYKTLFETPENKWKTGLFGMIIITSMLAGVFYYEANATEVANLDELQDIVDQGTSGQTDWSKYTKTPFEFSDENRYLDENSNDEIPYEIEEKNIITVTFTLTWEDEADSSNRHINQPDTFSLDIKPPSGETIESAQENDGNIIVMLLFKPQKDPYLNGTGEYKTTVNCHECGNQELWRPGFGLQDIEDTGNDWTLAVDYEFYEKSE